MTKKEDTANNCNMIVMPQQITDNDITALFNGLISVIKKKYELENKTQILNTNLKLENLIRELKAKQAECNRLKNQLLTLNAELEKAKRT